MMKTTHTTPRVALPDPTPVLGIEPSGLRAAGMLLVGATGRNNGKTEFVCSLLRRYAPSQSIAAAKVTTVSHGGTGCPRGGEGCGVCASLDQPFNITHEIGGPEGKDTVRMQQAGASPVMWLRARREALQRGAEQLLPTLGHVSIAESNRMRSCVDPDLFLLIRGSLEEEPKESAAEVLDLADAIVHSDGRQFTPPPDFVTLVRGRWVLKRQACGIVMAGGRCTRLGANKALVRTPEGVPLIQHIVDELRPHVQQILISTNDPESVAFLGLPTIPDQLPDRGPLMGLVSALQHSQYPVNLVVSCDLPELDPRLITLLFRHLGEADACIPVTGDGKFHPLLALYRDRTLLAGQAALDAGASRVVAMAEHGARLRLLAVDDITISNMNTLDDMLRFGMEVPI